MASTSHSQSRTVTPNMSTASAKQRGPSNGVTPRAKNTTESRSPMRENMNPDKQAHDRLLFVVLHMCGRMATITVKNGDKFSGVLSSAALDNADTAAYLLKMTKKLNDSPAQANGVTESADEYIGHGEDHAMSFAVKDVAALDVQGVPLDKPTSNGTNGTTAGFKTDTDISGNMALQERELQAWQPSTNEQNVDMSLNTRHNNDNREWDQFGTNERLFGVKTDYNEEFYTTRIDKSAPDFERRQAAADKLARTIESKTSSNPHIAEERGQTTSNNIDEEDRFSGVRRDFAALQSNQPNKYTPPARRPPTSQATVSGAPVDPAIISSQLARPDSTKNNKPPTNVALPQIQSRTPFLAPIPPFQRKTPAAETTTKSPLSGNKEQSSVLDAIASKNAAVARQGGAAPLNSNNATQNVENDVLDSFKNFAAREREKIRATSVAAAKKNAEREAKLAELKNFSSSFKLKTLVPQDMLGILAKEKDKQTAIIEKSKKAIEDSSAKSSQPSTPSTGPRPSAPTTVIVANMTNPLSPTSANVPNGNKSGRPMPTQPTQQQSRMDRNTPHQGGKGVVSPRGGPGHLGERLIAQQQQYRNNGQMHNMQGNMNGAPMSQSRQSSVISPVGGPSRFNVQAMEFKPNPAAISFSPSLNRGSINSPDKAKIVPPPATKPMNRISFFGDKRPGPKSEKRKLSELFNPVPRLKKEAEATKEKLAPGNGGIAPAFKTGPAWETTKENVDVDYLKAWEKMEAPVLTAPTGQPMPHFQQLPPHMQNGQGPPHLPGQPMHNGPTPVQIQGRDHRFEDHRMQFSPSQHSSFPSPRMPVMVPYPNTMGSPMQPQFGQPVPYAIGPGGQPIPFRPFQGNAQFVGSPNPHFGTPMAMTPSNMGGYVMSPQMHGMQSPAQPHGGPGFYQQHNGGPQFGSPRGAPMMMHQGSQQGHAPGQYMYMQPGPHQGQMFPGNQGPPHMRNNNGGAPMMHQNSFHGSGPPHFQRQYSNQGFNHQGPPPQSPMGQHVMPQQGPPMVPTPQPQGPPPPMQVPPPAVNGAPNGSPAIEVGEAPK